MNLIIRLASVAIWFVSSYFLLKFAGKAHDAIQRQLIKLPLRFFK